jgi:hypothetical protein
VGGAFANADCNFDEDSNDERVGEAAVETSCIKSVIPAVVEEVELILNNSSAGLALV